MHQKLRMSMILFSIFISANQLISLPDVENDANQQDYDLAKESNLHFDFLPVNQKKISAFEEFISYMCAELESEEYQDLCD